MTLALLLTSQWKRQAGVFVLEKLKRYLSLVNDFGAGASATKVVEMYLT